MQTSYTKSRCTNTTNQAARYANTPRTSDSYSTFLFFPTSQLYKHFPMKYDRLLAFINSYRVAGPHFTFQIVIELVMTCEKVLAPFVPIKLSIVVFGFTSNSA